MRSPNLKEIDQIRKTGYRPQVIGCFLNDKKILFLYKKKHRLWQLPQGGIDNQETIEQATIREMTEELGEEFTASLKITSLFGNNQIEFPDDKKNSRELKTDMNKDVPMKGKKYFYVAINTKILDLDIRKTEFDNYMWLNYEQASALSKRIYQKGKQRVTLDILDTLLTLNLL